MKTLEEIAAAFGDKVVLFTDRDASIDNAVSDDKANIEEVEVYHSTAASSPAKVV